MIIDESSVINIIGKEQYVECMAFFQEMFERQCDYKIIMTRRCFSLYKIFLPILFHKGIKNTYGKIITDKALSLYSEDIRKSLSESSNDNISILIMDDIIIYGRTINSIIDQILENNKNEKLAEQLLDKILVRCIWQNRYNSKIRRSYEKNILPQSYASKMDWKRASCKYSSLIKSADIANTSYIISYRNEYQNTQIGSELYEYCKNNMIKNTNLELENLSVESYVLNSRMLQNTFFDNFVESCSLRIYFYKGLDSVVISPLVVLNDMSIKEMESLCNQFVEIFKVEKYRDSKELLCTQNEQFYSNKMQFISLLLSHVLLCSFLKYRNIAYDTNKLDYKEILDYNFTPALKNEFTDLGLQIYNQVVYDDNFYKCTNESIQLDTSRVEKFLFRQAMLDNQATHLENASRLDGFSKIDDESIFSSRMMSIVISLIDSGKAALKSSFKDNRFVSKMYAGEQAFRIMNDKFEKYLKYLYDLERYSVLYSMKSYDLYKNFIQCLRNNNLINDEDMQSLLDYIDVLIEASQQISDVYVYNDSCKNLSIETCLNDFMEKEVK